jgi:ribonuclease BN (tRNA processing enzyme)
MDRRSGGIQMTVLGKSPSWPDAGGACSGYLVEHEDTCLLLDCGSGVLSKLRLHRDYLQVDAVVLSHLHADHFLDLFPFAYALTYSPRQTSPRARPQLHAPSGARDVFRQIAGAWGGEELIETAFALTEYETADEPRVGSLRLRFREVAHFVPTRAVEVAAGTARLTYGADHGPSDDLVEFATGTDLLLMEATLSEPETEQPRGHLTAAEAGEHGRRAGARRLVITHLTDELDATAAQHEAARTFEGPVEVATDGAVYAV